MHQPTPSSRLRRTLAWYGFALATVVTVAVGVVLVLRDSTLTSNQVQSAIGLNLIAAAIFSAAFAALSTWISARNDRDTMVESFAVMTSSLRDQLAADNLRYLPVNRFPPSDSFDDGFNRVLMDDIGGSRVYDFCGPSARFVAARLAHVRTPPQQVRVAMMDPGSASSIVRRAADRQRWASSAGRTLAQLQADLRDELLITIVALFDYRTTAPVRLVYTDDAVVYRMELTDRSLFFSWYHGPDSAGKEMPEAVQFSVDSMYYQVMQQEMTRRFEVLRKQVHFESGQSDDDLLRHLHEMTGRRVDAAELATLRADYDHYADDFHQYLTRLGY